MTDVVCSSGWVFFGTPARTNCGNTTSAPTGHLLLKEKAFIFRPFSRLSQLPKNPLSK